MSTKLTPWYPINTKPVRIGWYHVRWGHRRSYAESGLNWWWNGSDFVGYPDDRSAGYKVTMDVDAWRGLAEQPK